VTTRRELYSMTDDELVDKVLDLELALATAAELRQ
jgi:hypothetical protein